MPTDEHGWETTALSDDEQTIIEYWFKYLKLNSEFKDCCDNGGQGECADLYSDFGNIHAEGLTFAGWFTDHKDLFIPLKMPTVDVIKDVAHFADGSINDEDLLYLRVNRYCNKQELRDAFSKVLDQFPQLEARQPLRLADYSIAKYKTTTAIETLRFSLLVYNKVRANPEQNLIQIGIALFQDGELLNGKRFLEGRILTTGLPQDERDFEEEVRRHYTTAKKIIRNTANPSTWNRFPVEDDDTASAPH